jgi:hypothetical protein
LKLCSPDKWFHKNPQAVAEFKKLAKKYKTPSTLQKFIRTFSYNEEADGPELKSAWMALQKKNVHCLEAAFLAAAILEQAGYPPLILSLESIDHTDHVLFLYKEKGKWGTVGYSQFEGLYGRKPVYRSIRDLVWSYYDVYICNTGKITAYEVIHLDESQVDWRFSKRSVWKLEKFLINYKHRQLISSKKRHARQRKKYLNGTQRENHPRWL